MEWTLRLVGTEIDGQSRSCEVIAISRPDGLGDIAALGLTLAEAGGSRSVPDQGKNDNDRNGYTQPPQQNSTAHCRILQSAGVLKFWKCLQSILGPARQNHFLVDNLQAREGHHYVFRAKAEEATYRQNGIGRLAARGYNQIIGPVCAATLSKPRSRSR